MRETLFCAALKLVFIFLLLIFLRFPFVVCTIIRNFAKRRTSLWLHAMMIIKRMAARLSRVFRSRGFGVQSPSAYQFIRYVLNEHAPYYAYGDLRETVQCSARRRRLLQLYLRLANYQQQKQLTILGRIASDAEQYIHAGCRNANFRIVDKEDAALLLEGQSADAMLVVEDIAENEERSKLWNTLLADERTGVSYDLYDCGIIFFDLTKYKCCYKVNF